MTTRSRQMGKRSIGIAILAGLASFSFIATLNHPATAAQQAAAPRYVYASGAQGVRYYPAPAAQAAPRPRTVGPGVRNWATGQKLGMHKPWLQAR